MSNPMISDRSWSAVIEGRVPIKFDFLAIQLSITTLRQRLRTNEIALAAAIVELKNLVAKYGNNPAVQRDLNKIAQIR